MGGPRRLLECVAPTQDLTEGIAASVDYAGLADGFAGGAFGTETMGTVTERPLKS
jgi:hypothetical protein